MNTNLFIKDLFEDTLGLDVLGLEFMYPELIKMINKQSLKTFSANVSCAYDVLLDLGDTTKIRASRSFGLQDEIDYELTDPILQIFNLPILDILTVKAEYQASIYNGYSGGNMGVFDILLGSEQTTTKTLASSALPFKKYFTMKSDKILTLRGYPKTGKCYVKIRTRFPSMQALPEFYAEEFKTLCKYDIKIKLWNQLKFIEDIVTPNGNLNLKISDWESAERDRVDYLKDLKIRAFPDMVGTFYYTVF